MVLSRALESAIVLVICFTFLTLVVHAQDSLLPPPRHAVKISTLHLINPELASVQVSYEYRFAEQFGVEVEGGYVFGDVWWSYPSEKAKGYKLKQDLRWYFRRRQLTKRVYYTVEKGTYLALEFHQNRVEYIKNDHRPFYQSGQGIKVGYVRYSPWGFMFDMNIGLSFARGRGEPFGIPLNGYDDALYGYKVIIPTIGFRLGQWLE